MVDKRKGMSISKLDLEVEIGEELVLNEGGIYKVEYTIHFGRDGDYVKDITVYCHSHHDRGIRTMLREHGLLNKRIKKVSIMPISRHGDTVTGMDKIKQWKITKVI